MQKPNTSILLKVVVIAFIALLLLIPTVMVEEMVIERKNTQIRAISEVSDKWASSQTFTGPFISIPYDQYVKEFSQKDSSEKLIKIKSWMHFLPHNLAINGNLFPEKRYRGIYEVVVYESKVNMVGQFHALDLSRYDIDPKQVHFDKATLNLGVSDLKGIEGQIKLDWNNEEVRFMPGTSNKDLVASGINCPINLSTIDSAHYQFSLDIHLKGSQYLHVVPLGKTTNVKMKSTWNNPSFDGEFLPDERTISREGFEASWNVLHLNRNYPQTWSGSEHQVSQTAFGVNLLLPIDKYHKSMRVIKYALLFIAFTFMVFFFIEVLNGVFIHPIQYILVGIAMIIFYSLLLAMSEYISFNASYAIASLLTLVLITSHLLTILKSRKLTLFIFGILTILYGFIFIIIQLQDYSLLIGSIGVFLILAIVMYYARRIDWYNIKLGEKTK